jgi:hypothetical protein
VRRLFLPPPRVTPARSRDARSEHAPDRGGAPVSGQGAPEVRRPAALLNLPAPALRPAPPPLRSGLGVRPQGQRRVHGPAVPIASPRAPPLAERGAVVEQNRHRSDQDCAEFLAEHAAEGDAASDRPQLAASCVSLASLSDSKGRDSGQARRPERQRRRACAVKAPPRSPGSCRPILAADGGT